MDDAVKKVLELSGLEELNPVQREAVNKGLVGPGNMVVAAPTASGKTLLAEIAALKAIGEGKKVIYIVPLRALASEKHGEFREKYEPLGIRVAVSIGDYDKSDPWLAKYDLIIATSEKLDSLLRHGISWVREIGLVVADEVHLLDSPDRGPTLEVVLTRLMQVANPRILALSATINNYKELSEWLGAVPLKSDYRPVKLHKGVCYDGEITFIPRRTVKLASEHSMAELVTQTLDMGKQSLIFINTRKGTESEAERVGKLISRRLNPADAGSLKALSERVLHALDHPTKQCERLSRCISMGSCFHHAGLAGKQRSLIEQAFKEGTIKTICATPTLAAGINMPSFRVMIRDLKRFSSYRGMDFIPILEAEQMCGRAGRPSYDTEGEAILLPKNRAEAEYAWKNYIMGEPEKITSKLGVEPVLRMHVLSLIASGVTPDKESLFGFFSKTFYAHQYKDLSRLGAILDKILALLEDFGFITTGKTREADNPFKPASSMLEEGKAELKPTRIGKRVSELYIDPLSADHLIKSLGIISARGASDFGILHVISNCLEMKPLLSMRQKDFEAVNELLNREGDALPLKPPREWDLDYDEYLKSLKTASMFKSWVEESGEDRLLEDMNVTPGELRARLERADWLLYAAQELGLLLNHMSVLKDLRKVRLRVRYGIREELLPLVRLKGVGRVIARKLWQSNLRSLQDLRKAPMESLSRITGRKRAEAIKDQLGEINS